MLDALLGVLLGILCGTLTGMVPGLHVNTLLFLVYPLLLPRSPEMPALLVCFIAALSVTHSFVSYVPSILLSAPQEDTALSVLPGQRLLGMGRGYEAVYLTVVGGIGAMAVLLLLLPLLVAYMGALYGALRPFIGGVLLLVLAYMVATEGGVRGKLYALLVVLLSGTLGYMILHRLPASPERLLFPALTGLFGASTMLLAMLQGGARIPEQELGAPEGLYPRGAVAGALAGVLAGMLPGVGAAQSAYLVRCLLRQGGMREFLVAQGGVNTVAAVLSILTIYLIGRPRSGSGMAVERVLTGAFGSSGWWKSVAVPAGYTHFMLTLVAALVSAPVAGWLTLRLARACIARVSGMRVGALYSGVLLFLGLAVLAYTGALGLLVLLTATAIGMLAATAGVKRSHGMGVLILPVMLYFIFER